MATSSPESAATWASSSRMVSASPRFSSNPPWPTPTSGMARSGLSRLSETVRPAWKSSTAAASPALIPSRSQSRSANDGTEPISMYRTRWPSTTVASDTRRPGMLERHQRLAVQLPPPPVVLHLHGDVARDQHGVAGEFQQIPVDHEHVSVALAQFATASPSSLTCCNRGDRNGHSGLAPNPDPRSPQPPRQGGHHPSRHCERNHAIKKRDCNREPHICIADARPTPPVRRTPLGASASSPTGQKGASRPARTGRPHPLCLCASPGRQGTGPTRGPLGSAGLDCPAACRRDFSWSDVHTDVHKHGGPSLTRDDPRRTSGPRCCAGATS